MTLDEARRIVRQEQPALLEEFVEEAACFMVEMYAVFKSDMVVALEGKKEINCALIREICIHSAKSMALEKQSNIVVSRDPDDPNRLIIGFDE